MIFDITIVKRLWLAEDSGDGQHFLAIEYLIKVCPFFFLELMLLHTLIDYSIV